MRLNKGRFARFEVKGGLGMFLHLGSGYSVRTKEILAIFDYAIFDKQQLPLPEKVPVSCLEEGEEGVKSLVLTDKAVYLSAISSLTLKKRAVSYAGER